MPLAGPRRLERVYAKTPGKPAGQPGAPAHAQRRARPRERAIVKTACLDEALVASLLDDTYDAAVDAERWPALLKRLTTASGAHGAMFAAVSWTVPERGFITTHGLDDALIPVFLQRHQMNPWSLAAVAADFAKPIHPRRLAAAPGLRHSDFFGEILVPQHIVSSACVKLDVGSEFDTGGVGLYFDAGQEAAEDRAVTLLAVLAPHLQRAAVASQRLRAAAALHAGLTDAFERLAGATLLVDRRAQIVFANARARRLLAMADGLCSLHDGLAASRPADTQRLRRLIDGASRPGLDGGGAAALARHNGRAPLAALVIPLRRAGDKPSPLLSRSTALVFVTDPDDALGGDSIVVERLRALYGLTPAEARAAMLVARGRGLQETAAELGIGAGTVHTHMKRVFEKTGVRRQSSLARLLTRCGALDFATVPP